MTGAYTTVVMLGNIGAVFFEGRHAYTVEGFNETFAQDLYKGYMKSVEESKHYIDGK